MWKIEIPSNCVRQEISKNTGKPYFVARAFIHLLDRNGKPGLHPSPFGFFVRSVEAGPAAGLYVLAPSALEVDFRGNLNIRTEGNLIPAKA